MNRLAISYGSVSRPQLPVSLILLGVCVALLLVACTGQQRDLPRAQRGILDLSGWDLEKEGSLNLNGEWDFYWRQLINPEDFASESGRSLSGQFVAPGIWNNYVLDGKALPGDGYGTFRLRVKMVPDEVVKAVRIKCLSTAYILYINGKKIARNGTVGQSPQTTVPQFLLQEISFFDNSEELDVILQVANFNHRRGGISHPILFGTAENLRASHNLQWFFDICLFGCLFIMGIYYFSIFFLNREDRSPLFLALVTLNFAVRILVTDYYYLTQVFPNMSWELLYTIELTTIIFGVSVILLFITSLFGKGKKLYFQYFLISCISALLLLTIFTPARIASHLVKPSQIATLLVFLYCFFILIRALREDAKKAGIVLLGFSLLFLTAVADILNANQIIYFSFLAHFGILCLIFSQSFVLSVRFSDAFRDVRQLSRELEEKNIALQRLDKLKDEFLANTTHELRTPLNGMIGMAESLVNEISGKLSAAATSNLQTIIANGRRLNNLVNDVLDFSRLKNRDVTLNRTAVDIRTLTSVVLSVLQPLVGNNPVELINGVDAGLSPAYGDEDRLQQILYNLVGNAIKFTDTGSVKVTGVEADGSIKVTVADTGIGISPDRLEEIFAPYQQGESSASKGTGGTGLGLTIVENLVTLHGGTITVASTPGRGSEFTFTIPINEIVEGASTQENTLLAARTSAHPLQGHDTISDLSRSEIDTEKVLVVDDDPVNLQVVANHLSAAEIPFTVAVDGQEALSLIEKSGPPAMVLLDIMMPVLDGYEVCRRLRERYSQAELPIVLLTARNSLDDLVQGLKLGGNDYLTKPFSSDELLARVQTHLRVKDAHITMQENLKLKREVDQRKKTEQHLIQMQRRLSRMLDSITGAVLAVNESGEICFCNKPFARLTGYQSESLLGKPLSSVLATGENSSQQLVDLLDQNSKEWDQEKLHIISLACREQRILSVQLELVHLDLDSEQLVMIVAAEQPLQDDVATVSLDETQHLAVGAITELNQNLDRLRNLESSLSCLAPDDIIENPPLLKELQSIDSALANLAHGLEFDMDLQEKRKMAVDLMNDVLEYWQSATGLEKAALAGRSELWKVYMDYNGWERTQTLDKYLDIRQLPNRPRWKQIVKTADFVLTECELVSPLRDKIESTLRMLRVQV